MNWEYKLTAKAIKDLRKLGHESTRKIFKFLDERIQGCEDPRKFGKNLSHDLKEYWRYRVGDYRLLCEIKDDELVVLVVKAGHRRGIYD